jgi:hypothetical protein
MCFGVMYSGESYRSLGLLPGTFVVLVPGLAIVDLRGEILKMADRPRGGKLRHRSDFLVIFQQYPRSKIPQTQKGT